MTTFLVKKAIIALFNPNGSFIWSYYVFAALNVEIRSIAFDYVRNEVIFVVGNEVG